MPCMLSYIKDSRVFVVQYTQRYTWGQGPPYYLTDSFPPPSFKICEAHPPIRRLLRSEFLQGSYDLLQAAIGTVGGVRAGRGGVR